MQGDELGQRGQGNIITRPWHMALRSKPSAASLSVQIYENDEDEPPTRKNPSVRFHKTIQFESSKKFEELSQKMTPNGSLYRMLAYELQMSSTSTSIDWRVMMDGQVQGQNSTSLSEEMDKLKI